jgi:hypothetical protein
MTMLRLTIRGGRFVAARAAADRGIGLAFVRETPAGETIGLAGECHLAAVQLWIAETASHSPARAGDLMAWGSV